MASEVLRGGFDKVREAGCILCGGHTINDDIPKYGLAVNGFVNPNKILRNSTAKAGDLLILTKPIGSGILTTATKGGLITEKEIEGVLSDVSMLAVNAYILPSWGTLFYKPISSNSIIFALYSAKLSQK